MNKKYLSERDICTKFITPALTSAGWDVQTQVREEVTRETADLFLVLIMHRLKEGGRAAVVLPDGTLFGEGIKTRIKEQLLNTCNLHTVVRLPNGVFNPYTGIKTNLLFFTKGTPTEEVWFYEHPYPPGYKNYSKTRPMVDATQFPDCRQVAPDCIEKGTGRLTDSRTVAQAGVRGPNQQFRAGQLLYSKIRPSLSKAVLVDFDGLCSADMYPLDIHIEPRFMLLQILSEIFLSQVRIAENRVKMPKLNQESLNAFLVCVPSLTEQRRIVAKVDELMALCDRLQATLATAREHRARLADTLVQAALEAA